MSKTQTPASRNIRVLSLPSIQRSPVPPFDGVYLVSIEKERGQYEIFVAQYRSDGTYVLDWLSDNAWDMGIFLKDVYSFMRLFCHPPGHALSGPCYFEANATIVIGRKNAHTKLYRGLVGRVTLDARNPDGHSTVSERKVVLL